MDKILKKFKDITSDCCVTITLGTHRTKPDNLQDPINLKNLLKEAEDRLMEEYDKRLVWSVMEKLNGLSNEIDHNYNQEGLVLFANEEEAAFTRLPIAVQNRTVVDKTFATRDLVRAMHLESGYYALVLGKDQARLIEAQNDAVINELGNPFPIENTGLYSTSKAEIANAGRQTNLAQEFFNRIDKLIQEVVISNPLPILVIAESSVHADFMQVVDNKDLYIGHLAKNVNREKAHNVVVEAWEEVKRIITERNAMRMEELRQAVSEGKFKSDITDIWHAILNGKGKTLFVEKGFYQPAQWDGATLTILPSSEAHVPGVIDDIIDEMIEHNMRFGGDTVFLSKEDLNDFQGLALITRY